MALSGNWSASIPSHILLYGKGGHAKVIADELSMISPSTVVTSIDDADPASKTNSKLVQAFPPDQYKMFVAIGDNGNRKRVADRLLSAGYGTFAIVSGSARVSMQCRLGDGTFVGPMSCINAGAEIGSGCIINTAASIDHDCIIGDYAHIAPGCHLCGGVLVGERTLLGVGTSVAPKVRIGNQIVIAAGSSINRDVLKDRSLYAGVPARFKKRLDHSDFPPEEERISSS